MLSYVLCIKRVSARLRRRFPSMQEVALMMIMMLIDGDYDDDNHDYDDDNHVYDDDNHSYDDDNHDYDDDNHV